MAEIQQLNETTLEATLVGGDKVEIGDRDAIDFKPHLKLNRWDGECFIKVGLPTTKKIKPVVEGNKTKWVDQDIEAHFYPLEPRIIIAKDKDGKDVEFKQNELGGFEFEVILKKKPKTNKIVFDIETQGLKFYYQRELTPEKIAEGTVRPDNVVGSYAVYHATKRNHIIGQTNYMCGKASHIYRPKIVDAEGNWVWGELSIDESVGTLTTTIPQEFLDSAVYPISTGTTNFGYETPGGSREVLSQDLELAGSVFTSPAGAEGATVISMTTYYDALTGTRNSKAVLVTHGDLNIIANGVSSVKGCTGLNWFTHTYSTSPTLSASTEYVLMAIVDTAVYFYYDDGEGTDQGHEDATNSYATPTNPTDASHVDQKYSIYCTYEAAAPPAGIIPQIMRLFRNLREQ